MLHVDFGVNILKLVILFHCNVNPIVNFQKNLNDIVQAQTLVQDRTLTNTAIQLLKFEFPTVGQCSKEVSYLSMTGLYR